MQPKKNNFNQVIEEDRSNLRKGIDVQREYYKRANIENNYDIMSKAIENIKSEIKHKAIARNKENSIKRISKILTWYKTLPFQYSKNTVNGRQTVYPPDIEMKISHNLQIAYEITVDLLGILDLI